MHYTRRQIALYHREAQALEQSARADRIEEIGAAFSKQGGKFARLLRGD